MDLNKPWKVRYICGSAPSGDDDQWGVEVGDGDLIGYFDDRAVAERLVLDHAIALAAVRFDRPGEESKYGQVFCTNGRFHPGEPLFILRATDPLTPFVIRNYATTYMIHTEQNTPELYSEQFLNSVFEASARVLQWQTDNPTLVNKAPD